MYFNSIAGSYNGSTAAFEAVNLGSIPSPAAEMENRLLIEFVYADKGILSRLFGKELIQTKPFRIGFFIKNIGDQPIQKFTLKNIRWSSSDGQDIFAWTDKSFDIDTLNPNQEKMIWVEDKTGTYMYGLCNISINIIPNNQNEEIITFQRDHFSGEISRSLSKNHWIDFFFIRSKNEYEQSMTNKFNIFLSCIFLVFAYFTYNLTKVQTKYTEIQSIPEQINQARALKNARELCSKNPENVNSGIFRLDGSGKEATCSEVLK